MQLITHKEAAALIQIVSADTLRKRKNGKYVWHPELTRYQEKVGATIWMSLEEVQRLVAEINKGFQKEPRRIAFSDIQEIAERGGKGWQRAARFLAELNL
jgi:hypothetical protein